MSERTKVGVIGVGGFGKLHVQTFAQLKRDVELVGLCARTEERVVPLARQYGVDYYTDHHQLLKRDDLDAVSICLPSELHYQIARDCLLAGKHVLLEKPITSTVEEGEKLAAIASSSPGCLMVGHTERFNVSLRRARALIQEGSIGNPVMISGKRRTSITRPSAHRWSKGGLIDDLACHDVDIVQWFLGQKIVKVYAETASLVKGDVEDTMTMVCRSEGGAIVVLETTYTLPGNFPIEENDTRYDIVGTHGTLMINNLDQTLALCNKDRGWLYPGILRFPGRSGGQGGLTHYAFKDELEHFINCVRGQAEPEISAKEATDAIRVVAAAVKSARIGKPIHLEEGHNGF